MSSIFFVLFSLVTSEIIRFCHKNIIELTFSCFLWLCFLHYIIFLSIIFRTKIIGPYCITHPQVSLNNEHEAKYRAGNA